MEKVAAALASPLQWGVSAMTHPGHSATGDEPIVQLHHGGVLVGAVDALGHGEEAAVAARTALSVVQANASQHVIPLVRLCHDCLQGTRGVVMSLASLETSTGLMTWLGIGNVNGFLVRAHAKAGSSDDVLLLRAGVVGVQLPPLQAAVLPLARGDTLVFATDGVRSEFARALSPLEDPKRAADRILSQHHKGTDDALVLVARFLGDRK